MKREARESDANRELHNFLETMEELQHRMDEFLLTHDWRTCDCPLCSAAATSAKPMYDDKPEMLFTWIDGVRSHLAPIEWALERGVEQFGYVLGNNSSPPTGVSSSRRNRVVAAA